jgi:hypothetical protein
MRGRVNKLSIGSKIAFKIPKTTAASAAFLKLSISIPKGNLEIIKKLTVVTNQVRRMSNIITSPIICVNAAVNFQISLSNIYYTKTTWYNIQQNFINYFTNFSIKLFAFSVCCIIYSLGYIAVNYKQNSRQI